MLNPAAAPDDSLVIITREAVIFFQVTDYRLNACTLGEYFSLYPFDRWFQAFEKDLAI